MAKDEPIVEPTREPKKIVKEETVSTEKGAESNTAQTHAVPAPVTPLHGPIAAGNRRHTRTWVIGIVAGIVVLYIVAVLIGLVIYRSTSHDGMGTTDQTTRQQFGGHGRFSNEQTYNVQQSNSDGLTTTTTNTTYTQTQGVVTAVSGDSITVAGGGKSQVIKTNASTTYVDDTKPAVNDTLIVVGTKDGDTITATQVEVYSSND